MSVFCCMFQHTETAEASEVSSLVVFWALSSRYWAVLHVSCTFQHTEIAESSKVSSLACFSSCVEQVFSSLDEHVQAEWSKVSSLVCFSSFVKHISALQPRLERRTYSEHISDAWSYAWSQSEPKWAKVSSLSCLFNVFVRILKLSRAYLRASLSWMEEKSTQKRRATVCLDRTGVSRLAFCMFCTKSHVFRCCRAQPSTFQLHGAMHGAKVSQSVEFIMFFRALLSIATTSESSSWAENLLFNVYMCICICIHIYVSCRVSN